MIRGEVEATSGAPTSTIISRRGGNYQSAEMRRLAVEWGNRLTLRRRL